MASKKFVCKYCKTAYESYVLRVQCESSCKHELRQLASEPLPGGFGKLKKFFGDSK